jgi:thiamine-phosphate pyrophosphorylase
MTAAAAAVRAPRLMLIVEAADVAERRGVIAAALGAGVDAVQLRDRRASGGALVAAARDLRRLTHDHSAALLVNDRIDVALAASADGVHLPADSFPIAVARRLLGPGAWIGRSTHSPARRRPTAADGADYVVLGPIFATPSKTAFGTPLGIAALWRRASVMSARRSAASRWRMRPRSATSEPTASPSSAPSSTQTTRRPRLALREA